MTGISRAALFGKLNPLAYKAIEGATVFCKLRGNPCVELQHWLQQILSTPDSDLHRIARHYELDASALATDLTAALERLPRGASTVTDLSAWVENAVERGWVYGSLMFGDTQVRTAYLLIGLLKTPSLRPALLSVSRQFERVRVDDLARSFNDILAGSPEAGLRASDGAPGSEADAAAPGEASGALAPAALGKQEALQRYAVDLTEKARKGELDPVTGRDTEIRQVIDILLRRRQNNPIVTGEAGVGKTAVVEGFAQRVAAGDVPPALKDVSVRVLDVGLLQAGASMKGEFEHRLRGVIDEVQASPKPVILFIDEAHTLIGAGGAQGTGDAANLLKPALARGTLRTIAATTWAEYKKYIEKDPALTRRFQVVQVGEPDEPQAVGMLRGVAGLLEKHHGVALLDEAVEAAVRLSHRYIPARQLPDKAVSLLDTACARVAVSQHATPPALEAAQRRLEALQTERDALAREQAIGLDQSERRRAVEADIDAEHAALATLQERYEQEKAQVARLLALRAQLRDAQDEAARTPLMAELEPLQLELRTLQGETPLILPTVDAQAVAGVVQDWTGIPVGRMVRNELQAVLGLADTLQRRVVGQPHALEAIARRIQTSRARLDNPDKPIGTFLLCGPSGVGKTETALALAEALYGGEHNLITINMSEFQEAHTVSTLKGAPPGYVGYGEGGVLTEAVRRRPYSVVLLDEVEKAHPDVHELFFQVFDKGWMDDGEGRRINFRNTVILLTSNVGSELILKLCADPDLMPDAETIARALREPLLKVFPAALLGRLVAIPYLPLDDARLGAIVRLQLERIARRVREAHGVPLAYDDAVVQLVVSRCHEVESGGRVVDALLTNTVLPRISLEVLERGAEGRALTGVRISVGEGEFRYEFE
ncbi:type VI secretion system ATPase TssH [Azohydromonas caseinilytica]|uniref:Type VI secretion system ATPase TssH n=1 Tax=Azohydromonas caseinilytica TaxID=2728836 RepID=A0A848FE36_9BURK|nr:type VI secretion system ATPase TssH [Azohydromonas caseinilytica]NML16543.1 type VI secretion system ATPase TssH [Azohydromonas caseinilytica]